MSDVWSGESPSWVLDLALLHGTTKGNITDDLQGSRQIDHLHTEAEMLKVNPFATEFFGLVVRNYFLCQF